MTGATYDFIVAGAGSAGCVLAARLAEDPAVSVLLVEAGGSGRALFVDMPAGNGFLFGNPRYDWGFESEPQAALGGRRLYYPRGKGLGGSSLLNGMIYVRGHRRDFDEWGERGLKGWSYADVLPYFRKSETARHRNAPFHGKSGPLRVTPAANYDRLARLFERAAEQAGAIINPDFNGWEQAGVGRFDTKVWKGRRQSTATAFLGRHPKNLTIETGARIVSLLMEGTRVQGVRYLKRSALIEARADRETIVCLGAFGSPQCLLLSGVGPADHLRSHGITAIVDNPAVGSHLQDHPNLPVQFALNEPDLSFARYQRLDRAMVMAARYWLTGGGPAAGPFWSTALFHALRDQERPDLQVYLTPMIVREEASRPGLSTGALLNTGRHVLARGKAAFPGVQFDINLLRPRTSGTVRLATADPLASPRIDPGYCLDPADADDLAAGLNHIRRVVAQPEFDGVVGDELSPGTEKQSAAQIASAIRDLVTTGHHPVGTCRMAADDEPDAVLDAAFRVHGVDRLRVVDASSFPSQIGGNPNAAIIMLAERAADMLLGRPPLAPEHAIEPAAGAMA